MSSPMAITNREKLPTVSFLLTSKRTENAVVIEDELEDIEDIKDNEEEREEKKGGK